MDHVHRPEGCILPHPDWKAIQEVSAFCDRGQGFSVSGIALRTVDRSPFIHQGNECGSLTCTYPRDMSAHVPGHLAPQKGVVASHAVTPSSV